MHYRELILFDSQAALKALESKKVRSKLVWNCSENPRLLTSNNKVTLVWAPGYRGIQGNQTADEHTRKESAHQFTGPEPVLGISKGCVRLSVNRGTLSAETYTQDGLCGGEEETSYHIIFEREALRGRRQNHLDFNTGTILQSNSASNLTKFIKDTGLF
ncbi:hypothetical protein NQ317_009917 [Molorchus minor]|uniref:RNase H type-1 domain-containing protein n=1 Tax=Molorchus minor TaxID=1323400 RepID=A0ABQ9K6F7_9CUCU|nr:hypothetical protein NQ317_009917 [Molorchus minor]